MAKATVVLGNSGSGKTTYVNKFLSSKPLAKKIYLINGSEFPNASRIKYEDVPNLKGPCILIIEDLIRPNTFEMEILKKLLLYDKRHKNIDVFILLHSVTTNNTYSLLQHADYFICTKSALNTKNFHELGVKILKLDHGEAKQIWKHFLARDEKYLYLKIDVNNRNFEVVELGVCESKIEAETKRKRVQTILSSRGSPPELSMALFDHIFRNFNVNLLDASDLSIPMKYSKSGKIKKVNICDLLYYMTTPGIEPTSDSIFLYKELKKRFSIPDLFICNSVFLKKK